MIIWYTVMENLILSIEMLRINCILFLISITDDYMIVRWKNALYYTVFFITWWFTPIISREWFMFEFICLVFIRSLRHGRCMNKNYYSGCLTINALYFKAWWCMRKQPKFSISINKSLKLFRYGHTGCKA